MFVRDLSGKDHRSSIVPLVPRKSIPNRTKTTAKGKKRNAGNSGPGELSDHALRGTAPDYLETEGIDSALTGMEIVGNDEGLIPEFGV